MELPVGWVHAADMSVLDGFNSATARHPAVVDIWRVVTDVLAPTCWRALALLVVVIALVQRRFRTAVVVVVAVGGAAVLGDLVKNAVSRPRPVPPVPIEHVAGWSFPSGHTLAAAAAATVLVAAVPWPRGRRRVATVAGLVILVAAVAISRLALGVHYLSDVVGGLALGVCWSLLSVAVGFALLSPHREQDERGDAGSDAVRAERPQ